MNLTAHREILPSMHPLTGPMRDAGHAAAQAEYNEIRDLLKHGGPILTSPRARRRYTEALTALNTYNTKDATK